MTTEQKVLAALSHFSILLFGLGMVIPTLFWSNQRNKSKYVSFQALQALAFQVSQPAAIILLSLVGMIILLILGLVGTVFFPRTPTATTLLSAGSVVIIVLILAGFAFYLVTALVGGIVCLLGMDFKYPIIGAWIDKQGNRSAFPADGVTFLEPQERVMAGLCHLNVILVVSGMIVPFFVWLTEKEKSMRLQREAAMALLWQGLQSAIITIISIWCGLAVILFPWIFMLWVESPGYGINSHSEILLAFIADGLTFLLLFLVGLFVLAFFQTYGLIAMARLMQGKEFRYPVIDKWIS